LHAHNTSYCVKITQVPNVISKASDSVFTVTVHCVYLMLQHTPSFTLEIQQSPALDFRCRLRLRADVCRLSSACPNSVVLAITRKILNQFSFLEIYVIQDIISSNLVLIVFTLYKFSGRSSTQQLLQVSYMSTDFGKRTFSYSSPATWNSIPTSIKNCPSLYRFKQHLVSSDSPAH